MVVLRCRKIVDVNARFPSKFLQISVGDHSMVARHSAAVRIKKCDGHGLHGLTATGKKKHWQQDSGHRQMPEAARCEPTPYRAAHRIIHGLDSDDLNLHVRLPQMACSGEADA